MYQFRRCSVLCITVETKRCQCIITKKLKKIFKYIYRIQKKRKYSKNIIKYITSASEI